jgi:hypothetical protein
VGSYCVSQEACSHCVCWLQAQVYRYDDEEWDNVVARDPDWDRAETDYLLGLCERYDLRFLVIADRYQVCCHVTRPMP